MNQSDHTYQRIEPSTTTLPSGTSPVDIRSEIVTLSIPKMVDANGLLEALFDPASRPSVRWLRQMQAQRIIPYVKIGHLVRFDVDEVREALREHNTVRRRIIDRRR